MQELHQQQQHCDRNNSDFGENISNPNLKKEKITEGKITTVPSKTRQAEPAQKGSQVLGGIFKSLLLNSSNPKTPTPRQRPGTSDPQEQVAAQAAMNTQQIPQLMTNWPAAFLAKH